MTTSSYPTIHKPDIKEMKVAPNLDYDKVRGNFDWSEMYAELDWLPGGGLNMAYEAIDRHANGRNRDKLAMIWEGKNGEKERYTFGQMKQLSDRFANVLQSIGIEKGDRVFVFMDRIPELYIAIFGILKAGAIAGPLFSAFGPEPVKDRLQDSGAKVLVTQPDLRRKITEIIPELFELQHIIVVNKDNRDPEPILSSDLSYDEEMAKVAQLRAATHATETLLVADALTGQDAVNLAREFGDKVGITGIVLTRADGHLASAIHDLARAEAAQIPGVPDGRPR